MPTRSSRPARPAKAFTAAALAILVDQGKIKLGRQGHRSHAVVPHVRSLGHARDHGARPARPSQRGSGSAPGDLLFVPRGSLSRKETVKRLAYIKPATSFRSPTPMTTSSTWSPAS
jgi:hypothetical protein